MKSCFLDSNVVLYLLSADAGKAAQALALLRNKPWISVQVLNEVTNVCRRKQGMSWAEIAEFLALVRQLCRVVPLGESVHDHARALAERDGFAFYDACIVAAALSVRCGVLWSEDMQDGRELPEGLLICNPFRQKG